MGAVHHCSGSDGGLAAAGTALAQVSAANSTKLFASAVSTAEDCYNVIQLGADGTGATSGILNAESPAQRIREMAEAIVRASKKTTAA